MATLKNSDTTPWNETLTINKQSGAKVTLETASKYVKENIELTFNVKTASPAFDGGALNNKGATATFTNMETSASNTSGVAILAKGTAGRDAVLYNGAVSGWVTKSDNASASAAVASSTWNGTTYYATGVTLTNGKSFNITVPNGSSDTVTFHFSVDANGNTTIT